MEKRASAARRAVLAQPLFKSRGARPPSGLMTCLTESPVVLGRCPELTRIERGYCAIGEPLNEDRAGCGKPSPRLERLRSGEDEIPGDEELLKRASLCRCENRLERVEVAMNVGDAQKKHDL